MQAFDTCKPEGCSRDGWRLFQLGLFFMPTSALLSGLALLASLTIRRPRLGQRPGTRPLTRWFMVLAVWMTISVLALPDSLEIKLRLFNWVPFFWMFCAATPYLSTPQSRKAFCCSLLLGTVPVVAVGLLQALFRWSGPWTVLGGLIAWEMPARFAQNGAGVFPNPNFTAAWYALVLPMLAAIADSTATRLLLSTLVAALAMTGSRTAMGGAIGGVLLLSWQRFWKPVGALLAALATLTAIALRAPAGSLAGNLSQRMTGGLANKIAPMLQGAGSTASDAIASGREPYRSELFAQAVGFVQQHPWLGKAQTLAGLAPIDSPKLLTHTHNIFFQLAIDHGLPLALMTTALVSWVVIKAWQRSSHQGAIDRALIVSATIALWLHAFDIPSFDSRINMLGWLLISSCWAQSSEQVHGTTGPSNTRAQDDDHPAAWP
ncbi:MAG: O-antigen ligase family protein [Cyanobacteria bacterium K_DeepCast_35m_m2_023]|nr:O-antigen ligase family protein [Cyanobacteria bacterium K_DeepCast_35m_m2_023]